MSRRRLPAKPPRATSSASAPREAARSRQARIVRHDREKDSRIFAYALLNYLHRTYYLRRRQYGDDLDLALIAEAIAIAAIDPRTRDPAFRKEYSSMSTIVGIEGQRGVNALSISASTAIPRETARRKIKRLVELGVVVETARGKYVLKPGIAQSPAQHLMLDELARETVRFINECLDDGVFQLS